MKKLILFTLFSLTSFTSHADTSPERQNIERLVTEIGSLYSSSIHIRKTYNTDDMGQLRACVADYGHLRDKAKLLRKEAKNISEMHYRVKLVMAADDAFSCVYCGGSGKYCQHIPPALEAVKGYLANESGQ